jgi:hypothetical protein
MKLRSGFVSNSSSSSFIVARDKDAPDKIEIKIVVDVEELASETLLTKEDVEWYLDEKYFYQRKHNGFDWRKYEPAKDIYDRCIEMLEGGKMVQVLKIDRDSPEHGLFTRSEVPDCYVVDVEY